MGKIKLAGMLQGTHRIDQRIEQIEHHQRAVLIEVKLAVGRLVAFAAHLVQTRKRRQQMAKCFNPRTSLSAKTARSGVTATSVVMRAMVRQGMENRYLEISLFLGANDGPNGISIFVHLGASSFFIQAKKMPKECTIWGSI